MKTRKHTYQKLTAAQIAEYKALKHSQEIAWETRNIGRAHELGFIIADLRKSNLAYRDL